MPDGPVRCHRHKVTRSAALGVQIHVRIDGSSPEKLRREGKKAKKSTTKNRTTARLDNFAAAFAAKSMEERIRAHKKSMLLAFDSIEKHRPKSIQPICRSVPKTLQFTSFDPDPPAIPAFVLEDFVKYMEVEQAAGRDIPPPLRRTYEPPPSFPKRHVKLKRLNRPHSATLARDTARASSRLRQEVHEARATDSFSPPKPRRPQTAKERPPTHQGQVEFEVERVLQSYQAKFQPHILCRLDKTWTRPCARPTPLHRTFADADDDGLPEFSLDFHGVDLDGGGIPGFNIDAVPTLSLPAFRPHILLTVDLSFANLTDAGCFPIATQLIQEPTITALNISGNPVTLLGVETLLEAVKCRALFQAIDAHLPPVRALYMHDMANVDVMFVAKLVELADLSLALTRDTAVVAVAREHLVLELESAADDRFTLPSESATENAAVAIHSAKEPHHDGRIRLPSAGTNDRGAADGALSTCPSSDQPQDTNMQPTVKNAATAHSKPAQQKERQLRRPARQVRDMPRQHPEVAALPVDRAFVDLKVPQQRHCHKWKGEP
ncbi:hypothetical protein, variant [Aphanomyces invadans]|uniref:Uncharacterized protein n=1 Tax=Aphanomyces invadans TaxID=157072 RepID=A0A024U5I5_9STRA|nr:hypothetical protein, variant [Aphanomyces invadans]ETW01465.1 hypothetical protein, variant [Aphanomyces invadans]|eukprot:XP_008870463.1 hypothetical protein, variant [Aphanomyces invadans]